MLLKPSEVSLYREVRQGGLGLIHIESICKAKLITVFIQTAANPRFMESLLHNYLYRYHSLEEHNLPNPGYPPYYSETFFNSIKKVKNETTLNPVHMTMKQWYRYLLEENVTMRDVDEEVRKELVPCRIEQGDPNINWNESYRLSRLYGLTPLEKSKLFCIIHELLPSNERLSRIIPANHPTCTVQCVTLEKMRHMFIISFHVWQIAEQCKHSFGASKYMIMISLKQGACVWKSGQRILLPCLL